MYVIVEKTATLFQCQELALMEIVLEFESSYHTLVAHPVCLAEGFGQQSS